MKRFLCWLFGHRFAPITDRAEIQVELTRLLTGRDYAMVFCERCEARFNVGEYLARGKPTCRATRPREKARL
jgi:hypothetical protein